MNNKEREPVIKKSKWIANSAIYLATYKDAKKIKGSTTEHSIYEVGRRLANRMNIYYQGVVWG